MSDYTVRYMGVWKYGMGEYITISSAVNVLSAYGGYSLKDAERIVKRNCGPYFADVVAVVRCRDCKRMKDYNDQLHCEALGVYVKCGDYCSLGVRKAGVE